MKKRHLDKKQLNRKVQYISAAVKVLMLAVIIIGIPLYIYFCHPEIIQEFSDITLIEEKIREYKTESIFIYIGVQILQIIICIIPGQELQFAAGYMYGFWLGYFFSIIGAALGTIATYYLARLLGKDAMHIIFGEEKINEFVAKMRGKKGIAIIFILYLIPGFPKDILSYAAGLSEIEIKKFLVVSLIARSPAMMGSLLLGNQIVNGNYTSAIIIGSVAVVLCILGIIFRNKVVIIFDKFYDKLMKL